MVAVIRFWHMTRKTDDYDLIINGGMSPPIEKDHKNTHPFIPPHSAGLKLISYSYVMKRNESCKLVLRQTLSSHHESSWSSWLGLMAYNEAASLDLRKLIEEKTIYFELSGSTRLAKYAQCGLLLPVGQTMPWIRKEWQRTFPGITKTQLWFQQAKTCCGWCSMPIEQRKRLTMSPTIRFIRFLQPLPTRF